MRIGAKRTFVSKPTLVDQITSILQKRIESSEYSRGAQLPVEELLCQEFSTSRTTIRGAIDRLVSKHLVIRRHGIGTFVTSSPKIMNPIDTFIDFHDIIKQNGFTPKYHQFSAKIAEADDKIRKIFDMRSGDKILEIQKFWTADNDPVVFCTNAIPLWLIPQDLIPKILTKKKTTEPIVDFFEKYCNQALDHYVASLRCDIVKNCNFETFHSHYKSDTPMLVIDEVGFSSNGVPIHQSVEYHPDNLMKFSITRRRKS